MRKCVELGRTYGRLTILSECSMASNKGRVWLARCSCGKELTVNGSRVVNGYKKSCGCLLADSTRARMIIHGMSRTTREHKIWRGMKYRCFNPNHPAYPDYGARGIAVCSDWMDFRNFYRDMGNAPSRKHGIERIDNNGPYCKDNCKWATQSEQLRNTRRTRWIEYDGLRMCMKDWAAHAGMSYQCLRHRLRRGWSIHSALSTPQKQTLKDI